MILGLLVLAVGCVLSYLVGKGATLKSIEAEVLLLETEAKVEEQKIVAKIKAILARA
jgi:hypothetical protein